MKTVMHLLKEKNRTACGKPFSAWSYGMFVDREEGDHITCKRCRETFDKRERLEAFLKEDVNAGRNINC